MAQKEKIQKIKSLNQLNNTSNYRIIRDSELGSFFSISILILQKGEES